MPDLLTAFLVRAKRKTYAAAENNSPADPLLPGSRQLEYREDPFLYRDIYFGFARFAGQETVYQAGGPVWSMVYFGGVEHGAASRGEMEEIYSFLRQALRLVDEDSPFRGPRVFDCGLYTYRNTWEGSLEAFWGQETISRGGEIVYSLQYSGGFLR